MNQPYSGYQIGAAVEPLDTNSNLSVLFESDPALAYLLDFASYCITTYPGTLLVQTAQRVGADLIRSAVGYRYPSIPSPGDLQATQIQFPLLAIGRTETHTEQLTAAWEHDKGFFELLYVLPVLTTGQKEALLPILHEVGDTLRTKVTQGWDPGYTPPGGTQGQQPWALQFAGVEEIGFGSGTRGRYSKSIEYGYLQETAELLFPCIRMFGFMVERDNYNPVARGAVKLTGIDTTVDMVGTDGTVLDPFMQTSTQMAPTVAVVSPAVGPVAGGTAVTVTGTLFLPGPVVYVGVNRAFSVTWNSATSLTVVTPAGLNPGSVSLTIIKRDGQSVSTPNAFTYQ